MNMSRKRFWAVCSTIGVLLSQPAAADMWSGCVQITSVAEMGSYGFVIGVPGLAQACRANGIPPTLYVAAGQGPAGFQPNAESLKAMRTQALLAKVTGQPVMVYFAEQNLTACFVGIIAIGGYAMQCN